jgi:hypothetical protein
MVRMRAAILLFGFLFFCTILFAQSGVNYLTSGEAQNITFSLDVLSADQAALDSGLVILNAQLKNNGVEDIDTNQMFDSCSLSVGGNMVGVKLYSFTYDTKYPDYLLSKSTADFKIILDIDSNVWQFKAMALKLYLDNIKKNGGLKKLTPAEKKKIDDVISSTAKGIFSIGVTDKIMIKFNTKIVEIE